MQRKQTVNYVTSSKFKKDENQLLVDHAVLKDGIRVGDLFDFDFRPVAIPEMLEVDIERMVKAEVRAAYAQIRMPCLVEHAGLIFEDFNSQSYPGGLTKPMWDTLKENFIKETASAGRRAIARAVIAYCDGMHVYTFTGDTMGTISDTPRGKRHFYWDVVFVPDDASGRSAGKTYAEINDDPILGLTYKVKELSQSTKAMMQLLEFLRTQPPTPLWR